MIMRSFKLLVLCILFTACSHNNSLLNSVVFNDLPQPVRDTLISMHNLHTMPKIQNSAEIDLNDFSEDNSNDLIDLSGGYSIHYSFWHTWLISTKISNSSKQYVTKEHLPTPIVVYNDVLYIPKEYNLIVLGFENAVFQVIELK